MSPVTSRRPSTSDIRHRTSNIKAFTLVELLVVIGIIAVLISILLPALNRARGSASSLKCQSNLRQIVIATRMYAAAYKDYLPIGTWDGNWDNNNNSARTANGGDFTTLLTPFLGKSAGTTWSENTTTGGSTRGVFADVDTVEGETTVTNTTFGTQYNYVHYSAHPRLMGNIEQANGPYAWNPWMPPYKLTPIKPASEIILFFDAPQIAANGWNASIEAYHLDKDRLFSGHYFRREYAIANNINLNTPIEAGTNNDSMTFTGDAGGIRFRHIKNTTANVAFVDGHVESRRYKSNTNNEVLRKELCVQSQYDKAPPPHNAWTK